MTGTNELSTRHFHALWLLCSSRTSAAALPRLCGRWNGPQAPLPAAVALDHSVVNPHSAPRVRLSEQRVRGVIFAWNSREAREFRMTHWILVVLFQGPTHTHTLGPEYGHMSFFAIRDELPVHNRKGVGNQRKRGGRGVRWRGL